MTKKVSVKYTFPKTRANFIKVVKPDTEFVESGTYQITLIYDKQTAEKIKADIESKDARLAGLINYTERDDGDCQFKIKQNRVLSWMDRTTGEPKQAIMEPILVNSDNTAFKAESDPWGGTTCEVGAVIETQKGARGKGIIAALRLRGVRFYDVKVGGAAEGDGDPLFGGPVANAKVDTDAFEDVNLGGDDADDLPFDTDESYI
ncbi:Gp2.5-like ssDNA binding protein and ssDNA annealing protein [Pseudomonas phage tf]|jgi:hypothetical protein|uniref:DNA binding protein n=1 Tax=Pseudomonas phage tf TaxID=1114179 RepID=I2FLR1_9CAUD|nr:Gp2.5-like ssDNA binding protein and ssDNA annealing protein [Pseudomonas phage tf]CCE60795.1 DNA binding protein [Pseudomonas phage tf]